MSVFDDLEEEEPLFVLPVQSLNLDDSPFVCSGARSDSPVCCEVSAFRPRPQYEQDPNKYPSFVQGLHQRMGMADEGYTVFSLFWQERYVKHSYEWYKMLPDGSHELTSRPVESFPQDGTFIVEQEQDQEGYEEDDD